MSERIIKKQYAIKSKYPVRLFGLLMMSSFFYSWYLIFYYEMYLREFLLDGYYIMLIGWIMISGSLFVWGLIYFIANKKAIEKKLTKPIRMISGISNYDDLLEKINKYAITNNYEKQFLHLCDIGSSEYFTMYTNYNEGIEVIGVYYSDMYYAEMGVGPHRIKDIRKIKYKDKSKTSPFIDAFCGRKEDKYLSTDVSNPPKPINKILIVMINPKEKIQVSKEIFNLEEWHESHVLFVVIYENKPDVLYIGPDVRLYTDNSYQHGIEELCKMLNIKYVDYHKLIQCGMR